MLPLFATVSLAATLLAAPAPAAAQDSVTWKIDVTHSELTFRIRHLVSRVNGTFRDWSGTISADPANWNAGSVAVAIRTESIDTRNERRDTHLRSADFFDAASHPEIRFTSTSVRVDGSTVTLAGDLTIRGTTKPVTLTGEFLGVTGQGAGKERVGFEVAGKINRMDYGVSWNRAAEGGGVVLGDEVEIRVVIAAVRQ